MKCIITFFLLMLPFVGYPQKNSITIAGKTNLTNFQCVNSSIPALTLNGTKLPSLSLQVLDFDCRNKIMTSDFRKTLNHTQYPTLGIRFISIKKLSTSNYYRATFEVNLKTIHKSYEMTLFKENQNLLGTKRIKFSDFNITPPSRFGGKIIVKDDLDLSVNIATTL